jgi:ABC-2 type transport system ATP-binding protein
MSSHNLAEAQGLCDRIGIIKHGKLIHEQVIGSGDELSKTTFRVVPAHAADVAKLHKASHLKFLSQQGDAVLLQATGSIAQTLRSLSQFDIQSLSTQQISLEDEFLDFYGGDK